MNKIDVVVPAGKSGDWTVTDFTITPEQSKLTMIRAIVSGRRDEMIEAGNYKMLKNGREIVMSNSQMEINSNRDFINRAKGNVLINGLGIGMVLTAILDKPEVKAVTVVELSEDVIKLVAPTYQHHPKLTIVHESAFRFEPPARAHYDVVWHDIWSFISPDNVDEMDTLTEKYRQICDWQGCWKQDDCEEMLTLRLMASADW